MRVKVSASIDVVEAFETAVPSTPSVALAVPLKRREAAELQFGLKEAGDLIVVVKDLAEFVSLCWAGLQVLRHASATGDPTETPRKLSPGVRGPIPIEISTATAHVRIALNLDSTPEQIHVQLASLLPGRGE
jgi:hypothetical protein